MEAVHAVLHRIFFCRVKKFYLILLIIVQALAIVFTEFPQDATAGTSRVDSLAIDSLAIDTFAKKSVPLTNEDFERAADSLHVDVPTIQAVIDIEAGPNHKGFWTDGKPVVNFSIALFRREARKKGINLNNYAKTHRALFNSKSGHTQPAVQERLDAAMSIDSVAAITSTYWGMFQIGGFNWERCGTASPLDFFMQMSESEQSQLNLFVVFLRSTDLDLPLQKHDWRSFARGYNGAAYAKRGYHTRLAKAYYKYMKNEE